MRTVPLRVDGRHPFFFDHAVDHLPGNLLVAGLLGLADDVTGGELRRADRRLRLAFTFPAFGELAGAVELHCARTGDALELTATQAAGGTVRDICRGTVTVLPGTPLPTAGPATGTAPAEPKLVHRADVSTVMLGAPTEAPTGEAQNSEAQNSEAQNSELSCAVLRCPALAAPGDLRDPIEVIEAARQLVLLLGHVAHGHPYDVHVIWIELSADIPAAPPAALPLRLSWRRPDGRPRARTAFDMSLHAGDAGLGTVRLVTHTMSPAAYRKVRSA